MEAGKKKIALVTGASSGFGRMIANELAESGEIVYASMRDTRGRNAQTVDDIGRHASTHQVDLRAIELDVQSEASAQRAVETIMREHGRIDVVVHNAGHMVYGAAEAFTPEQLSELYDINVLGTQRVNRAVLPLMRRARSGLLIWISSTSVAGGVPPLLGPYFAAKAAMDALAVCYARELAPLGIETSIVVPGAFTTGTNHFEHAGSPDDMTRSAAYESAWPPGLSERMKSALASTVPEDADPTEVGRVVRSLVQRTHGTRPLRSYVDPAEDGAAVAFPVIDRVRAEFLHRIGFAELLHSSVRGSPEVT